MRALVVDDEPLARHSVLRFLRSYPEMQVVGECGDGRSAVDAILRERPELVFLDVQMPEMDGFEVVNAVGSERMPATIFVTAYDRYALRAFDANALDYLLKPFGKTRFDKALARARERMTGKLDFEAARRVLEMMSGGCVDRLPVSENGRIVYIKARDIQWVEAAGNYARLHVAGRSHVVRETLTKLEGKLNPKEFLRIHRSALVNVQYVKEVHPWFHGYHLVLLENGQQLRMSRYQPEVAERLGLGAGVLKVRRR